MANDENQSANNGQAMRSGCPVVSDAEADDLCPRCGAYAPMERGIGEDGVEWWERYCDHCDISDGDCL